MGSPRGLARTCGASTAFRPASRPELARCLIIGCGRRGLALSRELIERGHAVRGTTRHQDRVPEIEAAGAEPWVCDPDRIGTVAPALAQVGVVLVLLGSATGPADAVAALHHERLEMLLTRVLDSAVRGFVYEAAGTVDGAVLDAGGQIVSAFCGRSRIPFALLRVDPGGDGWVASTAGVVDRVLAGDSD